MNRFVRLVLRTVALCVTVSFPMGCAGTQVTRAAARVRGDVWFVLADHGWRLTQDEFFVLRADGTVALHPPPDDFEIEGSWKRTGNRIECEIRYVYQVETQLKRWATEAMYVGEVRRDEIVGVGKNRFGRTFDWRMVRGARVPEK